MSYFTGKRVQKRELNKNVREQILGRIERRIVMALLLLIILLLWWWGEEDDFEEAIR